jgi:hypothetical protein
LARASSWRCNCWRWSWPSAVYSAAMPVNPLPNLAPPCNVALTRGAQLDGVKCELVNGSTRRPTLPSRQAVLALRRGREVVHFADSRHGAPHVTVLDPAAFWKPWQRGWRCPAARGTQSGLRRACLQGRRPRPQGFRSRRNRRPVLARRCVTSDARIRLSSILSNSANGWSSFPQLQRHRRTPSAHNPLARPAKINPRTKRAYTSCRCHAPADIEPGALLLPIPFASIKVVF